MNVGCDADVDDSDIVVPDVWVHVYVKDVPSGSLEPDPSRVTVAPSATVWSDPALAVGASLSAVTVMVTESVTALLTPSVTDTWNSRV